MPDPGLQDRARGFCNLDHLAFNATRLNVTAGKATGVLQPLALSSARERLNSISDLQFAEDLTHAPFNRTSR